MSELAGEAPVAGPAPRRRFDDNFLRFLPAPLREPRRAWLAIATGWALSFPVSIALSGLVQLAAPAMERPDFPVTGPVAVFLLVVFAPFVETLIMAGFLTLLRRFMPDHLAILASAAGWGVAHSLQAPAWGLVIWWPFLIFSTLYVVWRERGFWVAVAVAATTHALQNLGPALLIATGQA